jgi:hypothetical protein
MAAYFSLNYILLLSIMCPFLTLFSGGKKMLLPLLSTNTAVFYLLLLTSDPVLFLALVYISLVSFLKSLLKVLGIVIIS